MFEQGKSDIFDEDDEYSDTYRWRSSSEKFEKRIKFFIFSNFSPADTHHFRKRTKNDEDYETRDVDLIYFRTHFIQGLYTKNSKDLSIFQNRTIEQMSAVFERMKGDQTLLKYDCFIFLFLTFMSNGFGSMEKIHFHDGKTTLDEIWKKVSQIPLMVNKPKIFLVQADDLGLLEDPLIYYKGGGFGIESRQIPTDADRLTIISTIPGYRYVEDGRPSFLIEAFVEEVAKNNQARDPLDFQSLMTLVRERVLVMISESKGERTAEMAERKMLQIPCTTTTFTKLLYL